MGRAREHVRGHGEKERKGGARKRRKTLKRKSTCGGEDIRDTEGRANDKYCPLYKKKCTR